MVPKVWVESQTRVAKGQRVGRSEAIQTGVVFSTLPLLVFVCRYRYLLGKEWNADIKNELVNLLPNIHYFFHKFFEVWVVI